MSQSTPASGPRSPLLLSARDSAAALSVCEKTLWNVTQPRGDLPAVRIGRRVLYAVSDLAAWIDGHRVAEEADQ